MASVAAIFKDFAFVFTKILPGFWFGVVGWRLLVDVRLAHSWAIKLWVRCCAHMQHGSLLETPSLHTRQYVSGQYSHIPQLLTPLSLKVIFTTGQILPNSVTATCPLGLFK